MINYVANEGEVVILAGCPEPVKWEDDLADIRDRYGITQLVFNQKQMPIQPKGKLGREFVIRQPNSKEPFK